MIFGVSQEPYKSLGPFVLRLFSVSSPSVLRPFSVRSPFVLRSFSVRSPFVLRSFSTTFEARACIEQHHLLMNQVNIEYETAFCHKF